MRRFAKRVVAPYIKASGYKHVCEIGSADGGNIDALLSIPGMQVCCIDPCVTEDLERKFAGNSRVRTCRGLSLQMLPALADQRFDCIMIDGDHNWYTVYHELSFIHDKGMLAKDGTILLHDVCWPYARRDMYYDLDTVPVEYRQPVQKAGILRGVSALSSDPTQGKNGHLWNATHEGGPRNGVLTAVEDFLREHPGYSFFTFEQEWGLGVIVREGENAAAVAALKRKARVLNTAELIKTAIKTATGRVAYAAR
jgi:hypothetical protein